MRVCTCRVCQEICICNNCDGISGFCPYLYVFKFYFFIVFHIIIVIFSVSKIKVQH